MDIEDATLPDGVDPDDVTIESDVEAFEQREDEWGDEIGVPFNPQNGRWYDEYDPGVAAYDRTEAVAGVQVNCAYEDCDGHTTVEMSKQISSSCPECGEPKMGRGQFSSESARRRSRYKGITERVGRHGDEFSQEMERLTDAGVGPAAAMDYLMCSVGDIPYEEWAEARDVDKYTVRRNMRRVAGKIGETVNFSSRGY